MMICGEGGRMVMVVMTYGSGVCVCEGIRYTSARGWRMVVMVVRDDGDDLDGMLVVA